MSFGKTESRNVGVDDNPAFMTHQVGVCGDFL